MSPDVLLECPRTSFRDVLRVNVTERVWHSPSPSTICSKQALQKSEKQPLNNTFDDTRVALIDDKNNAELQALDDQIKSMITKSDISAGPGKGKMASCNVCGKQGPYNAMPRHVEGNHITGVTHACDLCGKVCRSRHALSQHIAGSHQA